MTLTAPEVPIAPSRSWFRAAAWWVAAGLLVAPVPVVGQTPLVIQGATVIDGTGRPPILNAVIIVANGRIGAVGPAASTPVPRGARVIDGRGKFVIPGMMDANVHLVFGVSIEFLARYEDRLDDLIAEGAQVALANGLTTVFDSWGPLRPLQRVRDRIARGEIPGARLFVAGNIIGFTGPFGRDFNGPAETAASKPFVKRINTLWEEGTGPELMWLPPDTLRGAIRAYLAKRPDFIKFPVSGHTLQETLMWTPEQQRVIVEETRRAGIGVQTHTTSIESLRQALDAGVDLMQHCSISGRLPIPGPLFDRLKAGPTWCAIQAMTTARIEVEASTRSAGFPPRIYWDELVRIEDQNERRMIAAGIPVLLATDAGLMNPDEAASMPADLHRDESTALGRAHFLWFKAAAEKGMAPMDAILSATRNIARAYRKDAELGTIEPGKRADLVLLDADPLSDITNVEKIAVVIKDGVVVDRGALPLRRVLTRP